MARLLVSVRSAAEAQAALAGGAAIIDVKEPDNGALGRADPAVWQAVRAVTPSHVPVSVALGELHEWADVAEPASLVPLSCFAGIAYCKLGLARARSSWREDWARLRVAWQGGPSWVAVAYADWGQAESPCPEDVLAAALSIPECAGVLIDTYDKANRLTVAGPWSSVIEGAHQHGRFVALAGGLSCAAIEECAGIGADVFAVRGAACRDGDRRASVNAKQVAQLSRVVSGSRRPPS